MHGIMIRRLAAFLALATLGAIDAQAATRAYPSLAKRPIESRDRLSEAPAPAAEATAPADTALARQVTTLQAEATAADRAFRTELDKGRGIVSAARGTEPMSEPWVAAQVTISLADAARYESVAALASLDTLHVERQNGTDGARVAADLATINPARARVLSLVDEQNDALDALRSRLKTP